MQNFFDWIITSEAHYIKGPWLVLGKGPTFSELSTSDVEGYNLFSLNHVVKQVKVDIAHAIDFDVVIDCSAEIYSNAKYLLLPWTPHIDFRPGPKTLDVLIDEIPVLRQLSEEGRLLWYNKTGGKCFGESPIIKIVNFSAEVPYALLGRAGVKTIRSLGVDGGVSYSQRFDGLKTLLANGQDSFDKQFSHIANSVFEFGIDSAPLNMQSPIKVYVATTEEQMLSVRVLEYSIKRHSSVSVDVIPMHRSDIAIPVPKDGANRARTPFSFQRFLIPELAGYSGRGIYLDSDMQVFSDIRELWTYDMFDNDLISVKSSSPNDRRPQYSVMLLDCSKLKWQVSSIVDGFDKGDYNYEQLMYTMCVAGKQEDLIPSDWNSLEKYEKGKTKLLHYTDMNTQPWIYAKHPFGYVWASALLDAIKSGFIEKSYVLEHIDNGWARPSLRYQIENGVEDPFLLPKSVLALDNKYSPPYHKLPKHSATPWVGLFSYAKAKCRVLVYKNLYPFARRLKQYFLSQK